MSAVVASVSADVPAPQHQMLFCAARANGNVSASSSAAHTHTHQVIATCRPPGLRRAGVRGARQCSGSCRSSCPPPCRPPSRACPRPAPRRPRTQRQQSWCRSSWRGGFSRPFRRGPCSCEAVKKREGRGRVSVRSNHPGEPSTPRRCEEQRAGGGSPSRVFKGEASELQGVAEVGGGGASLHGYGTHTPYELLLACGGRATALRQGRKPGARAERRVGAPADTHESR